MNYRNIGLSAHQERGVIVRARVRAPQLHDEALHRRCAEGRLRYDRDEHPPHAGRAGLKPPRYSATPAEAGWKRGAR